VIEIDISGERGKASVYAERSQAEAFVKILRGLERG
jgi:hypothetical protein